MATGIPGALGVGSTLGWKTPRPPYPRSQLLSRVQGTTTVHFTTDASGNVASATIVKSTGNAALDASTLSFVRANWRGPANASRTTEFSYQIPLRVTRFPVSRAAAVVTRGRDRSPSDSQIVCSSGVERRKERDVHAAR